MIDYICRRYSAAGKDDTRLKRNDKIFKISRKTKIKRVSEQRSRSSWSLKEEENAIERENGNGERRNRGSQRNKIPGIYITKEKRKERRNGETHSEETEKSDNSNEKNMEYWRKDFQRKL